MSKIGDYVERVVDSNRFMNTVFGTLIGTSIASVIFVAGLQIYSTIKASSPNPPIYRDVNGDGVEDKIIQRKVEKQGFLWSRFNTLEDEVLLGIDVNGKRLYLSKDQFEEYPK